MPLWRFFRRLAVVLLRDGWVGGWWWRWWWWWWWWRWAWIQNESTDRHATLPGHREGQPRPAHDNLGAEPWETVGNEVSRVPVYYEPRVPLQCIEEFEPERGGGAGLAAAAGGAVVPCAELGPGGGSGGGAQQGCNENPHRFPTSSPF